MRHGGSPEQVRRVIMWAGIGAVLLIPLLAMQFTDEVSWTRFDFACAAVLLGSAGLLYEAVVWKTLNNRYRKIIGAAIIAAVIVIWAEGAVGIS